MNLLAFLGNEWKFHVIFLGPILQVCQVVLPDSLPFLLDLVSCLQLCEQESGKKIRRQIAGPKVQPAVFVHLPTEKLGTIGSLLSNYQCMFNQVWIVHDQGTALTAGEILGLVKALRGNASQCACVFAFISCKESMRVVLNHPDTVALSDST